MAIANIWTAARDSLLTRLRAECATWEVISDQLHLPISTCMDRARTIGAKRPMVISFVKEDVSDARQPLPPGHPTTWGLLTRGTVLEGVRYQ